MTKGADSIGTLHFAHFVRLANTHLGFFTIYDGSFETYIQDFTNKMGTIFDILYGYVNDPPPLPVAKNAEAFFQWNVAHNLPPIGYYSAYPGLAVRDIKALLADAKVEAVSAKRKRVSASEPVTRVRTGGSPSDLGAYLFFKPVWR